MAHRTLFLVFPLALAVDASSQQAPFETSGYPGGGLPHRVVVAPLDAGPTLDLLVVNRSGGGSIQIWPGLGGGSFAPPSVTAVSGGPWFAAAGDLDGDGDLDVVVSKNDADRVEVFGNDGLGALSSLGVWPVGASPRTVELLDMNGDGDLDVVVAASGSAGVTIRFGIGDGTFPTRTDTAVGQLVTHFSAADLDLDGDVDLVPCHPISVPYQLLVLRNDGAGGLSLESISPTSGTPTWGDLGDLDLDGYPDFAFVATELESDGEVKYNDGTGALVQPLGWFPGPQVLVELGDFDGDGDLDLLGTRHDDRLALSGNLANGSFPTLAVSMYETADDLRHLAVADFDGDGFDDAVTVHGAADRLLVHMNTGCAAGESLCSLSAGLSANAGGAQSLVLDAGSASAGSIYLLLGSASGTSPGFSLLGVQVPLNVPDPYFDFLLASPGAAPVSGGLGTLDAAGGALAQVTLPGGDPSLFGVEVDHAYVLIDPAAPALVTFASNAVPLEVSF